MTQGPREKWGFVNSGGLRAAFWPLLRVSENGRPAQPWRAPPDRESLPGLPPLTQTGCSALTSARFLLRALGYLSNPGKLNLLP